MDKEQEELERLEKLKKAKILYGDSLGVTIEGFRSLQRDLGVVLNSIKEKDKEIQFLKDINKQEKDRHKQAEKSLKGQIKKKDEELELYKEMKEIINSKATELVKLKQYDDLKKKAEKQDKIIDLMAEHIVSSAIVDDTICAIKCDCETDINEDCTHDKMLSCTKQYFERKATNDG